MKNKKSIRWIILLVVLILIILGLVGYILIDKKIINFKTANDQLEEQKQKEETITEEEQSKMLAFAKAAFEDETGIEVDDLDNETKINIISLLKDKSLTDLSGTEIKNEYYKYFGEKEELELVNITCPAANILNHSGDAKYLFVYDKEADSYIYNPTHQGHGGGAGAKSYISYVYQDKAIKEKDIYKLKVKVYYTNNPAYHNDTWGPLSNMKVYKNQEDTISEENFIVDAYLNDNYCQPKEDEMFGEIYECDYDKIYEGVKDDLNTYIFEFVKENDNLIFKRYYLEK